jgi:hypothetical protein
VAIDVSGEAALRIETDVDTDTSPAAVSSNALDFDPIVIVKRQGVDATLALAEMEVWYVLLLVVGDFDGRRGRMRWVDHICG